MRLKISMITILLLMTLVVSACSNDQTSTGSDVTAETSRVFTLEELASYDGQNGNEAYVAVDGVVYDVTDVPAWTGGEHNNNYAGQDLTEAIKKAPHGTSKLKGLTVVGTLE